LFILQLKYIRVHHLLLPNLKPGVGVLEKPNLKPGVGMLGCWDVGMLEKPNLKPGVGMFNCFYYQQTQHVPQMKTKTKTKTKTKINQLRNLGWIASELPTGQFRIGRFTFRAK